MISWLKLTLISVLFYQLVADNHEEQGLYKITTQNATNAFTYSVRKLEEFWSTVTNYSKRFLDKLTSPVAQLFRKNDEEIAARSDKIKNDNKEHGRLSIGRDILEGIKDKVEGTADKVADTVENSVNKIEETLGFMYSNESKGLDSNESFFSGVIDTFKIKVKAIYPGTKWCGDGNNAEDYDDLGSLAEIDVCCREHDNCKINIPAGETKYGLINNGLFTRSHCSCDQKFYDCLKKANTFTGTQIGTTYFTVLGPQCFKEDKKILNCSESSWGKCIKYNTESTGPEFYQWFDNPNY